MMCPNCDYPKTYIVDCRDKEDYMKLRRRRCPSCGYRFSTMERLIQTGILRRRQLNAGQETTKV